MSAKAEEVCEEDEEAEDDDVSDASYDTEEEEEEEEAPTHMLFGLNLSKEAREQYGLNDP